MPLSQQNHLVDKSITSHLFKRIAEMNKAGEKLINVTEMLEGDFSSHIVLVAPKPSGGLNIFLGDFVGRDLSVVVVAAPVADVFHEMTQKGFGISDIVEEINSKLVTILPDGFSCGACFIEMEKKCNMMAVWNGDLPDILVVDVRASKIINRIESSGLRLGRDPIKKTDLITHYVDISSENKIFVSSGNIGSLINQSTERLDQAQFEACIESSQVSEKIKQSLNDVIAYQHADFTFIEVDPEQIIAKTHASSDAITASLIPATDWNVSYHFSAELLRTLDIAPLIVNSVMHMQGMNEHRQRIYTIVAELCSNALEHGVLNLESKLKTTANGFSEYYQLRSSRLSVLSKGYIDIELSHKKYNDGGKLHIKVTDSGDGFDFAGHARDLIENKALHGRGESLLNQLCSEIRYEGAGNIVHVTYEWS
jgi:anti-sigma regulatory factor (Ser/Thr protein kinase)